MPGTHARAMHKPFEERIRETLGGSLRALDLRILQVNVGYRCNMACKHCHIGAGPTRTEAMEKVTMDRLVDLLEDRRIDVLDITGGAPEMNPHLAHLVREARKAGCHVIVRSNLTVFFERGFEYFPEFYREHDIEITASLPYYFGDSVDRVRGEGTYDKSIKALQLLNGLGYANGGARKLNIVYNPSGAFLAPEQKCLEGEFRRELAARHGIAFDHLFVFSNMPVGRFRNHLERTGALEKYQGKLEQAFNPATLDGLMCRHLVSIGWDGTLYDCDFNQVLGLRVHGDCPGEVWDFAYEGLVQREIRVGDHCYGCTAGQGST